MRKRKAYRPRPVRGDATAIDSVLSWTDVGKLYTAERIAITTVKQLRQQREAA